MTNRTITIDGKELEFNAGKTALEAGRRNNADIPRLCHLKGAKPTGACRICVVQVQGARSRLASCAAPAAAGMLVKTNSPAVVEARRGIWKPPTAFIRKLGDV